MFDIQNLNNNCVQKNKYFSSMCFKQWKGFFNETLFPCSIKPLLPFFYGDIQVTHYVDGFAFALIKAAPHRIYKKKTDDCPYFYILASRGRISWRNGELSGELPFGGIIVFDCNETIRCNIESDEEVISFLFPYSSLNINDRAFIDLHNMQRMHYSELIADIMLSMRHTDVDLFFKMRAIVNLLMLTNNDKTIASQEMAELKSITQFINDNVLNYWLSLSFVSSSLGISKSKIQKILYQHNLSYRELVKTTRVEGLAAKIRHNKEKTLSELCFECGFNTTSNAAIQFKKVKNISMTEYKKEHHP